MKKMMTVFLCLLLFMTASFIPVDAAETNTENPEEETQVLPPEPVLLDTDDVTTDEILMFSSSCIVMDADNGAILYGKNIYDRHFPASITKIMTALLTIENHKNLDDLIQFSQEDLEGIVGDAMNIGISDGEEMTVRDSLYAIMLASANEVANGAARNCAGSVQAFAEMMNQKAADLGCLDTHFVNPHGLHDDNHYTTAYDMALIAKAATQSKTFVDISGTLNYTVEQTNLREEGFPLWHKHKMVNSYDQTYEYWLWGKTGYTEEARNTLVTAATKGGKTLICVTLDAGGGYNQPYVDTKLALDYCFDHFTKYNICSEVKSYVFPQVSTVFGFPDEWLTPQAIFFTDSSASVDLPPEISADSLERSFKYSPIGEELMAPYQSCTYRVGTLKYSYNGQNMGNVDVYCSLPMLTPSLKPTVPASAETASAIITEEQLDSRMLSNGNLETVRTNSNRTLYQKMYAKFPAFFNWINDNFYLAMGIGLVLLALSILILRSIFLLIKRRYKRYKYKKLKKKRLMLETAAQVCPQEQDELNR